MVLSWTVLARRPLESSHVSTSTLQVWTVALRKQGSWSFKPAWNTFILDAPSLFEPDTKEPLLAFTQQATPTQPHCGTDMLLSII